MQVLGGAKILGTMQSLVKFSGSVSEGVYLATTFLLRFCSRASRTYCPIRHLENCDSVIDDVAGVVEIS